MIGLAGVAIRQAEPQLAALGLALTDDRDYGAIFSSASHTLRVTSEPHYAGLSISLRNAYGETFELGLLVHLLAPEQQIQAEGCNLENMVRFLQDNKALVFEQPAPYFAAYQEASRLRSAKLGLPVAI